MTHLHVLLTRVVKMDRNETILVVDDEELIRRLLSLYLERAGYKVDEAENGKQGLKKALMFDYDLIVLDLMLPGLDGMEICKRLRDKKATLVMMLTAKEEERTRLQGFEVGADDYVVKPFSPREVVLRVKALIRRSSSLKFLGNDTTTKDILVYPNLLIDHDAYSVKVKNIKLSLTPKEHELLYILAKIPGKIFSRAELLKAVWNYEYLGDLRTVDTHVKRLRTKLNKASPGFAKLIVTVWGAGYKFELLTDQ